MNSGRLLAYKGQTKAADALMLEAIVFVEQTDCINDHAGVLMTEAEVLRRGNKAAGSAALIEQAVRLYEQKGNIVSASRARSLLQELSGTAAEG